MSLHMKNLAKRFANLDALQFSSLYKSHEDKVEYLCGEKATIYVIDGKAWPAVHCLGIREIPIGPEVWGGLSAIPNDLRSALDLIFRKLVWGDTASYVTNLTDATSDEIHECIEMAHDIRKDKALTDGV